MAGVKVTSKLAGKYGASLDNAVKKHAADDTTYGIINLPPGIMNGIARLSKCYFKEFEKSTTMKKADGTSAAGEWFFWAEGTVVSPVSIAGPDGIIPVKGLTTKLMVPLCDQKKGQGENQRVVTQDDQIDNILLEMRKLSDPTFTNGATGADLEPLAAILQEAHPYFRFSTSGGKPTPQYPNPMTFENWHGNKGLGGYQEEEVSPFNETTATQSAPAQQQKVTTPQEPERRVDAIVPVSEMSVEDLLSLALSEADTAAEARQRLTDLAVEAGYSIEEVSSDQVGWEDVVTMINNPKQEEEVTIPQKGQTANYAPPNKKVKGTKSAARECQITAVDESKQIVDLKDLTTKPSVIYPGVPWDELS